MSDKTINPGGVFVEGTPDVVACQLDHKIITPAAEQILDEAGIDGLVAFYAALVTHLACTIGVVLGSAASKRMLEIAGEQVDKAVSLAAAARSEVH